LSIFAARYFTPVYKIVFSCLLIGLPAFALHAQNKPGSGLGIRKAKGPIAIDGKLSEPEWAVADVAKDFYLNYPTDTARAPFQTEVRLTYDATNLYIAFTCFDDNTPDIVQSLRRDIDFDNNDNVSMILGPYNDRINGFFFTITPLGVQSEGTIASGGAGDDSFNDTWDNKWYSKTHREADRWIAELAIPFKSFRYKADLNEWNITFLRWDRKRNLVSSWIATPIQFIPASFAYSGQLQWVEGSPKATTNISVIPFVAGGASANNEVEPAGRSNDLQAGFDAKVAVTPSLNLDLTINPDFSQVEVDRQVINLTRFEFRFPERRQFFLENSDLFDRAGFPDSRPFFSRRIGLVRDTAGQLQRVPILAGARLSGSLNEKWRINMLNMQTRQQLALGLPAQNYWVTAVQRNFWKQSSVAMIFVNKESLAITEADSSTFFNTGLWREKVRGTDTTSVLNKFNRVLGADLDLLSADNKWRASFYGGQSFDAFNNTDRFTSSGFMEYTDRNYSFFGGGSLIQKNHNAEAGFVPISGVYPGQLSGFGGLRRTFYPTHSPIATMGIGTELNVAAIPNGNLTDRNATAFYFFNFLNTSELNFAYNYTFQKLTANFNPIDSQVYTNFLTDEEFSWHSGSVNYRSDRRELVTYESEVNYGSFYNGSLLNLNGVLNYRYQPFGSLQVRFDYNDIRLPGGYGTEKLFIVSPRLDLTFTDKLFLTTFVQYNTLADNVNLNARFQWRYKPASDFFLVYTENYLPQTFASKNRALVFKFTYWLNI